MKIISFQRGMPFHEILTDLQKKVMTKTERLPWRCYDDWSCLCIKENIYEQHCEHFRRYEAMVEENVTVSVHAQTENEDEIPWGVRYVGAERLWRKGRGEGVKVAVIDTGISRNHFDLKGRIKGGVNFVRGKQNGHGTHVAGIIVAEMNQRGIVGVSPEAHLYDVRAFDHEGKSSLSTILQALQWSIANQMDVINMSFGMPQYSEALARAVEKANEHGIVLVASAGNSGGEVEYPARYKGVMGVSAIDQSGKLASFSARGKGANMKAPGVEILSTWPGNQFKKLNGTSMAAPHVSGLMALEIGRKRNKKK
ncbi:aerolysin [Brevibacillus agri]|uniref:Aerolysin n=1 Tax=Brevibacillus agri TaxID=51101 RepID=A0A3M8AR68_9BACL|nr:MULTISPECIES: S8 family peptidase [Brevibacillus]ELK43664.1 serine protease [Brevibacillus agri BAB-2500]MCG5249793.1 S8 family peptidase [Brevibacillus agri]MED1643162.1 S8 family peptidase [Brevibacillus agri]MED1656064.1 S8 family peptidase [Brevibacillus agri]MED1686199.1 S8 family peptidase [Brevibacillus agri]